MLIDSTYLKHKLIDNAIGDTVSLDWVMLMIERVENESKNIKEAI